MGQVSVVVLGIMQDGGLPHAACHCPRCRAVYDGLAQAEYAACLAIVDARTSETTIWMIDATPDIKFQLHLLADWLGYHPNRPDRLRQVTGLFITHAHVGHIGGLSQLGPEIMAVNQLPVYTSTGVAVLLSENRLWRPVVERLRLIPLNPFETVRLAPSLSIMPVPVPHRDEWDAGTFAFHIQGPSGSLLYLPDIDAWELWPQAESHLATVDTALIDATFFAADELGGHPPVAHPLIPHTLQLFAELPCQLVLTHFNHTNPVLDRDSRQRRIVIESGAQLAQTGQHWQL